MAVAFDAYSTYAGDVISVTKAHVVGSYSNRLLIVGVSFGLIRSTTPTASYAGVAMTRLHDVYGVTDANSCLFALVAPGTGSNNVVIAWGGALTWAHVIIRSYYNVNQGNPYGAYVLGSGSSSTPSITVTDARGGGMVVDNIGWPQVANSPSAGAGQTNLITVAGIGSNARLFASEEVPSAASVQMSYTCSGSGGWYGTALSLYGLGANGQVIILAAERWKRFMHDLKAGLVPPDVLQRRYRDLVTI